MSLSTKRLIRKLHYWSSIVIAVPLLLVLVSGILLQLKKQVPWIQPPTMRGNGKAPTISFERILAAAKEVPGAAVSDWESIERLDVRPGKGIVKIRCKNSWEIQVDTHSGEVLQAAYRRSDQIEDIHDGTFIFDKAKLWVFLPASVLLLILWISGLYLFLLPLWVKNKKRNP
jgi:uncharacterized iron-regulated membrane protein